MMCKQACSLVATVIGTSLRPSFWHARNVDKPKSEIYANRLGWAPRCAWACVGCPVRSLDCAAKFIRTSTSWPGLHGRVLMSGTGPWQLRAQHISTQDALSMPHNVKSELGYGLGPSHGLRSRPVSLMARLQYCGRQGGSCL